MAPKNTQVVIYSDGACSGNPGPGGWGAILISGEHRKEISGAEELTTAVIALLRGYTLLRSTPFGLPVTAPSVDTVLALLALRPDERNAGEQATQVSAVGARATTGRLPRTRAR